MAGRRDRRAGQLCRPGALRPPAPGRAQRPPARPGGGAGRGAGRPRRRSRHPGRLPQAARGALPPRHRRPGAGHGGAGRVRCAAGAGSARWRVRPAGGRRGPAGVPGGLPGPWLHRRRSPGAAPPTRCLVTDAEQIARNAVRLAEATQPVVDSVCVHGDAPDAVARAIGVRRALEAAGFRLAPFATSSPGDSLRFTRRWGGTGPGPGRRPCRTAPVPERCRRSRSGP